jgi:hypothetical protein
MKDVADKFIRVRLPRVDDLDLTLFAFDYDLTFMAFFMDAEEHVYARYGGRDADGADHRHSLAGLRYTMESVLKVHDNGEKSFAPRPGKEPQFIRDIAPFRSMGRCMHCHQVKETLHADLKRKGKWEHDVLWRYPLPENLGFELELDRGNRIKQVKDKSAAAEVGLLAGDVLRRLGNVPVHSFGDAQYALDLAPKTGALSVAWQRGDKVLEGEFTLFEGWRKTDLTWRPSMRHLMASARLYGTDITAAEKKALGLAAKQLAFRQKDLVPEQARAAGVRGGDIILGFDDQTLEMDVDAFLRHVRGNYLVGERVNVNLLRDGQRFKLAMTFIR